jgi:hypothetical protein
MASWLRCPTAAMSRPRGVAGYVPTPRPEPVPRRHCLLVHRSPRHAIPEVDRWIHHNQSASRIVSPAQSNKMSTSFRHSDLGELKGVLQHGTAQFLGLKYATLRNRLAAAELAESYGPGPTDATKYG